MFFLRAGSIVHCNYVGTLLRGGLSIGAKGYLTTKVFFFGGGWLPERGV